MPPAKRRNCEYPGCELGPPDDNGTRGPYLSHEECQTHKDVVEDIQNHVEMAHRLPLQVAQNSTNMIAEETKRIQAQTARTIAETNTEDPDDRPTSKRSNLKRTPIPRPSLEENSTESDWSFF